MNTGKKSKKIPRLKISVTSVATSAEGQDRKGEVLSVAARPGPFEKKIPL